MIGITFLGGIVYASGLLRSTSYDAHSFEDTKHMHPQQAWERNIGDGHFGTLPRFFTPVAKQQGRHLDGMERQWNLMIQHVRARVEHVNRIIKSHTMLSGVPYRGYALNLAVFVKLTLHATAEAIRRRKHKLGHPRYQGFGPHRHNPAQVDE